jgi:hypothetical protein
LPRCVVLYGSVPWSFCSSQAFDKAHTAYAAQACALLRHI